MEMQFNPDKNKQAIQVIFSQKKGTPVRFPLFFNGSEVVIKAEHKHLGMILDSKLTFLTLKALGFFLLVQHWGEGVFSTPSVKLDLNNPESCNLQG